MKFAAFGASCLILVAVGGPALARGAFFPTYHPKPCEGESCRADDERSGVPCTGLSCSFSSAKALQRPVTASEAAETQARATASAALPAATPAPEPAKKKRKTAAKHPKADTPHPTVDAKLDSDPKR